MPHILILSSMFDGTLSFSAVIHTRLRLMSSLIQIASESIGDSVKERRHPDTLLFVDEHTNPFRKCGQKLGNYYFFISYFRNYT